jgi:type III restriction enzyme
MSEPLTINIQALEPLFRSWEEPCKYRVRAEGGEGAMEKTGRRPSSLAIAQSLRAQSRNGVTTGTSERVIPHGSAHPLFLREHRDGEKVFRYYFCQREAIETLIYLKEVRRIDCLSQLVEEFGGTNAQTAALGITDEEDEWTRFAFKMATGTGKTKVMSLAIVWSYFHALRESDSTMAKHFVVIAPNLTVFERLKEDFKPEGRPEHLRQRPADSRGMAGRLETDHGSSR